MEEKVRVHAIYREACPNCGGPITDERLEKRLPCHVCLPQTSGVTGADGDVSFEEYVSFLEKIVQHLKNSGKLQVLYSVEKEVAGFQEFFERALGSRPWSAQITWARRVFKGYSFAILAPTGVGKTAFGVIMSLYLASKGKRAYVIVPTTTLLVQVYQKALSFASKVGLDAKLIAVYHSKLSTKEKEENLERIARGDYGLLLSTPHFLVHHAEKISNQRFDFIFVDDVDSVLKSSKNVDRILLLLGFSPEEVSTAFEIVRLKSSLASSLRNKGKTEELLREIEKLQAKLSASKGNSERGVLLVSTATGRARGMRVKLFRELLGFEVGSRSEQLRNIVDVYALVKEEELLNKAMDLVVKLGEGGLVFFPIGTPEETLLEFTSRLAERGLRVEYVYKKAKKNVIERFSEGELDVLVGIASYYGLLVRGIDLPHVVKYAIFVGVPRFKFRLKPEELTPTRLIQLAANISEIADRGDKAEINRLLARIRNRLLQLDAFQYRILHELYVKGDSSGRFSSLVRELLRLRRLVEKYLSDESTLEKLTATTAMKIIREDGEYYVILPDVFTYLQASGRTSRLYAGGISKGLSLVIESDSALLDKFLRSLRFYTSDSLWKKIEDVKLDELIQEISQERVFIRGVIEGKIAKGVGRDLVKSTLVIVESPTKARTIASFFGKPTKRRVGNLTVYETSTGDRILQIVASQGHVFDLVTSGGLFVRDYPVDKHGVLVNAEKKIFVPVFTTIKKCLSCGKQFTDYKIEESSTKPRCPYCGSERIADKLSITETLRELASEVDEVLLATDPDTEGEKIAWDVYLIVKPFTRTLRRVEFHEVTRRAFEEALRKPRAIDLNLVKSQLVRRIEDRWIGFTLSKKLQEKFGMPWLSAGRVQTPVLGWVIERHRESVKSVRPVFKLTLENNAYLIVENIEVSGKRSNVIAKSLQGSEVIVSSKSRTEKEINPPPPYTTDTMLHDANRMLGLSADAAMRLAQQLFESGLITYHRTDSTHVSDVGLNLAKTYISEKFGAEMFRPRKWGMEGAHECIRPTRPLDPDTLFSMVQQGVIQLPIMLTRQHFALYRLIFQRFIASQMPPAVAVEEVVEVRSDHFIKEYAFLSEVKEEGFLKVLPLQMQRFRIAPGKYRVINVEYKSRPLIPLYSQADLVGLMRQKNIGRPSTYAEIIRKLFSRNYVIEVNRGKVVPTKLGVKVYEYLRERFGPLISEETTARVLEKMDEVERGVRDYRDVLLEFYNEILQAEKVPP